MKYITILIHNNRYLPLPGLLTYFVLPEKNRELFQIFHKYFTKYLNIFHAKIFIFYINRQNTTSS